MVKINININNKAYSEEVGDNTLLVELLRDKLGLTGTHVGCDTSQCGACVIHVDGDSVKSCTVLAAQVHGKDLTTVEGLASEGQLHPIQKSFQNNHALQCGFCTPGLVMSAVDLLKKIALLRKMKFANGLKATSADARVTRILLRQFKKQLSNRYRKTCIILDITRQKR